MKKVYANRELSWLKFNQRVLEEGAREEVPLCERLNFISIYQTNLDEFFRVRVGSLVDLQAIDPEKKDNKTGMTALQQRLAVTKTVRKLDKRKEEIYDSLMEEIKKYGIEIVNFEELSEDEVKKVRKYFDDKVRLLLSPHIVGRRQPFPFIRNCEIHAVASLGKKNTADGRGGGRARMGIVSCSVSALPRLVKVSEESERYILIENLILNFLDRIYRNYRVEEKSLVRIIRNADIDADDLYDEGIDYREFMSVLMKRRRLMAPVRMELSCTLSDAVFADFCKEVKADPNSVFISEKPLDLAFLSTIQQMLKTHPELFYKRFVPPKPGDIAVNKSMIRQVKEKDRLLCYPYESMQPFLRLLKEAANDPDVLSIKMTLYRVAKNSQVVEHLIEAAENGKEVDVLLELKARFDEENNIAWSQRLEEAGCQVIYGLSGIKIHSKICLIVRKGADGPEYISQIGTGNFNEVTARLYTDYSLLTADQKLGRDVASVFQTLGMDETPSEAEELLVAPNFFLGPVLKMMDEEIERAKAGEEAYIGIKINSLTDKDIIDKLIEASKAGVKIEMIVRGICCLKPQVPNETENIRVISIVGRFLEHSRVYIFGTGEREKMYISSGDFMTRNTVRRVEVGTPIKDKEIRTKIRKMFDMMLKDNSQAWELQKNGVYVRVSNDEEKLNTQAKFCELAYKNAEEAPFGGRKTLLRSREDGSGEGKSEKTGFIARLFHRK